MDKLLKTTVVVACAAWLTALGVSASAQERLDRIVNASDVREMVGKDTVHLNAKGLTIEAASVLAGMGGKLVLELDILTDDVAKALAGHRGDLSITVRTEPSDAACGALSEHLGPRLSFKTPTKEKKKISSRGDADMDQTVAPLEKTIPAVAPPDMKREKTDFTGNPDEPWEGAEDLMAVTKGLETRGPLWVNPVELFVRYGTQEAVDAAEEGREAEFAGQIAEHAKSLATRHFYVSREAGNGDFIMTQSSDGKALRIGLRAPINCHVDRMERVKTLDAEWESPWFLRKDGSLGECPPGKGGLMERQGAILYWPERPESWVSSDIFGQARENILANGIGNDCCVLLHLGNLRKERVPCIGFFKANVARQSGLSTTDIKSSWEVGLNGREDAPNYFVTETFAPPKPPQWRATADLLDVVLVRREGDVCKTLWSWSAK